MHGRRADARASCKLREGRGARAGLPGLARGQMVLNTWILYLMNRLRTHQRDWPGKRDELKLYNVGHVRRSIM